MNERIYELIRLSAVPADRAEDYAEAKGLIEPTEKLDVAKFAELIVRECATIMHEDTSPNCPYVDYFKVTNKIKEHFGVEE